MSSLSWSIRVRIGVRRLKRRYAFFLRTQAQAKKAFNPNCRTALVTGAGSGVGRAIALRLVKDGWQVAIADTNRIGCQVTLKEIQKLGGKAHVENLQVSDNESWQILLTRLRLKWLNLDLLVNSAGVIPGIESSPPVLIEDWQRIIDTSLWGTINGCHAMAGWLKINPWRGHIVNISTTTNTSSNIGACDAARAAVISLSKTLRNNLKRHGIGVSVVCPSYFINDQSIADQAIDAAYKRRFFVRLKHKKSSDLSKRLNALVRERSIELP